MVMTKAYSHNYNLISLISAQFNIEHGAEVKMSVELGALFNNSCQSPQLDAEVTSVLKLLVPNIDCSTTIRLDR